MTAECSVSMESFEGAALTGWSAEELLDWAQAVGPGAEAGLALARARDMDEVSQRDRVRLTGLLIQQARWCEAQAALVLGGACIQADEQTEQLDVSPARSLIAEAALTSGVTLRSAQQLARVGRTGWDESILGQALEQGHISVKAADVTCRAAGRLENTSDCLQVLALGIRLARMRQTTVRIEQACERLAAELSPDGLSKAHTVAYQERGVWLRPRAAGMSTLTVYGATHELAGVYDQIEQRPHQDSGQTPNQRRYDAFISSYGQPPTGKPSTSRYQVLVRLDASTLLGRDNRPGLVLGAGPIPAEVGRVLAKDATWRGLFVDPASGRPVWVSEQAFRAGITLEAANPSPDGGNPWGEPEDWPLETANNNSYLPGKHLKCLLMV
ncbi:MAG: 13E12 repeat family protein, partial [Bifidobacteriaceae bacterium]|nr:13E12 repeat family protein [Bifidobacteriaceae bacterium]